MTIENTHVKLVTELIYRCKNVINFTSHKPCIVIFLAFVHYVCFLLHPVLLHFQLILPYPVAPVFVLFQLDLNEAYKCKIETVSVNKHVKFEKLTAILVKRTK